MRIRHPRGAGLLLGVGLVIPLLGAALLAWHASDNAARREAALHDAGRLWAAWLVTYHRVTQREGFHRFDLSRYTRTYEVSSILQDDAFAAPGQARGQGIRSGTPHGTPTLGVIADTTVPTGEADRFAALVWGAIEFPSAAAVTHAAIGARKDLRTVHVRARGTWLTDSAQPPPHLSRVETRIGRTFGNNLLFATADTAVPISSVVLHRRPQPGHPRATHMETALALRPPPPAPSIRQPILAAAAITAREATVTTTILNTPPPAPGQPPAPRVNGDLVFNGSRAVVIAAEWGPTEVLCDPGLRRGCIQAATRVPTPGVTPSASAGSVTAPRSVTALTATSAAHTEAGNALSATSVEAPSIIATAPTISPVTVTAQSINAGQIAAPTMAVASSVRAADMETLSLSANLMSRASWSPGEPITADIGIFRTRLNANGGCSHHGGRPCSSPRP